MIWYGVVWCGVVWCGVVWCGVVWHGIWYGIVWYGPMDALVDKHLVWKSAMGNYIDFKLDRFYH